MWDSTNAGRLARCVVGVAGATLIVASTFFTHHASWSIGSPSYAGFSAGSGNVWRISVVLGVVLTGGAVALAASHVRDARIGRRSAATGPLTALLLGLTVATVLGIVGVAGSGSSGTGMGLATIGAAAIVLAGVRRPGVG